MLKTANQIGSEVLTKLADLSDSQRFSRNVVGTLGVLPYVGGLAAPIYAGATAPKGEGWSRAGGVLGWEMLGSVPGYAALLAGRGMGNAGLQFGGLAAGLLGQGLGAGYGMHRAIAAENEARGR